VEEAAVGRPCELQMSHKLFHILSKSASEIDHALEEAFEYSIMLRAMTSPKSNMCSTMVGMGGSADRCSNWNGYDFSKKAGAMKFIEHCDRVRPRHVWWAPPCTVWTRLQAINNVLRTTKRHHCSQEQNASVLLETITF
jgi:hypothetical protein